MTLAELRKKRSGTIKSMDTLVDGASAEDRDLTAEEQTQYDTMMTDQASMKTQIERMEAQESLNHEMDKPTSKPFHIGAGIKDNENMDKTGFESFGDFISAVASQDIERLESYDMRTQDSSTGSEGGFLIPTQFQEQIMQVSLEQSIVRERATVIPAGTSPDAGIDIPYLDQSNGLSGGLKFSWTNDDDEKPDAGKVNLRMLNLKPEEVSGTWTVPNKTLRNTSALAPLMMQLFGRAYTEEENNSLLFGNGVGKPHGALMGGAVFEVLRAASGKISYKDTIDILKRRIPGENGYVWLSTLDTEAELALLQDAAGQYIYKPTAGETLPSILHGRPNIVNQYSPQLGQAKDLSLVDLSKYIIKDGAGMMIDISTHSEFKSAKTVFRFINNIDAGSWVKDKIKLKNGLLTSPFITLK